MSKMGLHDPFEHLTLKLYPKERSGVKLAIWLPTIKSQESPQYPYVKVSCNILLKSSWRNYNFSIDLISIQGLHKKLWAPKVVGVPTVGISRFPLGSPNGSPGTKWHLGASPMAKHKVYYKGEVSGFPQVRVVVSFVSSSLPLVNLSTKSAPTMH